MIWWDWNFSAAWEEFFFPCPLPSPTPMNPVPSTFYLSFCLCSTLVLQSRISCIKLYQVNFPCPLPRECLNMVCCSLLNMVLMQIRRMGGSMGWEKQGWGKVGITWYCCQSPAVLCNHTFQVKPYLLLLTSSVLKSFQVKLYIHLLWPSGSL